MNVSIGDKVRVVKGKRTGEVYTVLRVHNENKQYVTLDVDKGCDRYLTSSVALISERPAKRVQVRPGFWNCCRANPAKMIQFEDNYGRPVWHYACRSCASTVEQSRVQDADTPGFTSKYVSFHSAVTDCTSEDGRYNEGSAVFGSVRYALRMARAAVENGLSEQAARYLRLAAHHRRETVRFGLKGVTA